MAGKSPIIKRVGSFKFELIDLFDLYSHVPVLAKGGKAMIENVNQMDNEVTVRLINNPSKVFTADVRNMKLMLRGMSYFRSKDIKIVAGLALDQQGFEGTSSTEGNKIIMANDVGTKVVIDLSRENVAISVVKNGKVTEAKNLPYIIAYMIKNGFDLYGLLGRGFAVSTSSIQIK